MANPKPSHDVVSSFIRPAAKRAIDSLLQWVKFNYKDKSDHPILLILALSTETVNSYNVNTKPYQIILPHPIKPISTTYIILLIDDNLSDANFSFPNTSVVTFVTFNSTFSTPAARREIFLSSSVFIVDGRVFHSLEKQVGERLFEKKRKRMELFQIELGDVKGRVRWKEQIERRLGTTKMKFGNDGVLVGSTTSLSCDQIVNNVVCLVNEVVKGRLEEFGGLEIVKEILVKTRDSVPLSVYRLSEFVDFDDCDDKNMETKGKNRSIDVQKKLKGVKKRRYDEVEN